MRRPIWIVWLLGLALLLTGCGSAPEPEAQTNDQPPPARLGDTIDVSLAHLLHKPRVELAELADEWLTKAQLQEKARREGRLAYTLLPQMRFPLAVPVWREAKYSAKLGISLPPYHGEDDRDGALALHLARYGDIEAARMLADPADTALREQIEACRFEQNYPAEWIRLVGLMLHVAQVRLAASDLEGGTELACLHKQLGQVLDAKAAKGPLGAVLLNPGRTAFIAAAAAWREDKKAELVEQANAIVAAWGEPPARILPVKPGASKDEVARALRSQAQGRIVLAGSVTRALDVLGLPLPGEGAQAIVAFLDGADRLSEWLVTYRIQTNETYPKPIMLAHALEDARLPGQDSKGDIGLHRRIYHYDGVKCEAALVTSGAGIGGLVRLGEGKTSGIVPRQFGAAALDRSFELQRLLLAAEQRADTLHVTQPASLGKVTNPLPALKPAQADLQQQGSHDLAAAITLRYAEESTGPPPLHQIVAPFWALLGAARMEGAVDDAGGHLALTWDDGKTGCTFRLPFDHSKHPTLELRDRQGNGQIAQREQTAAAQATAERLERLTSGQPLSFIPRHLEECQLGMTKGQLLAVLPTGRAVLKQEIPDGLSVVFNGEMPQEVKYLTRQLVARFDRQGKVVELRARYFDGPAARSTAGWMNDLLTNLKKTSGAPSPGTAQWGTAWPDQPARSPAPAFFRWRDDVTWLSYQRDASVVEITVRDCPADQPAGVPLPPLEFIPRGVERCVLGMTKSDLLTKWQVAKEVTTADGALVLSPNPATSYDVLLVWFDQDRAVRIVARHAQAPGVRSGPERMGQVLTETWGRQIRGLGWPVRQEFAGRDVPSTLGWLDERTRVRLFWQENDDGTCRLFTEWKALSGR